MVDAKAYTEVHYILNEMSEDLKNKIPKHIREVIEENRDRNYNFYIDEDDWESVVLLEDTEKILSVLYTDYLATEEEKQVIRAKENILQKERRESLPKVEIKDMFSEKKDRKEDVVKEESITVIKEKWYKRAIKLIKGIFAKRIKTEKVLQ